MPSPVADNDFLGRAPRDSPAGRLGTPLAAGSCIWNGAALLLAPNTTPAGEVLLAPKLNGSLGEGSVLLAPAWNIVEGPAGAIEAVVAPVVLKGPSGTSGHCGLGAAFEVFCVVVVVRTRGLGCRAVDVL